MFIVIEGPEAAGKSTLANVLHHATKNSTLLREPGSTKLGEDIRTLMKSTTHNAKTRQLLMHACRMEMISQYNLEHPEELYILDRYIPSMLAYATADGIPARTIESLIQAFPVPQPDIVIWLVPKKSVTVDRLRERQANGKWEDFDGSLDRLGTVWDWYNIMGYVSSKTRHTHTIIQDQNPIIPALKFLSMFDWFQRFI